MISRFKFLLFCLVNVSFITATYSQNVVNDNNKDKDSLECLRKISIYKEFQKQNMRSETVNSWKEAYKTCKSSKKIIFQDGVKFIKQDISKSKNSREYNALLDSLMNLYEKRVKYFGEEGYVRGMQGIDLMIYGREQNLEKAFGFLKKSLEFEGDKTDPAVLVALMNVSLSLNGISKLSNDAVLENYFSISEILAYAWNEESNPSKKELIGQAIDMVDNLLGKSKVADCQKLEKIFGGKFAANQDDTVELIKIQKILRAASCFQSDLFYKVSAQIQEIKPTSDNSYILAGISIQNEVFDNAVSYFSKAIELEKNDTLKAKYYYEMALVTAFKQKKWKEARDLAYESIKLNPRNGKPYILIGDCYAENSNSIGTNKFENAAVYWAAVDKYLRAKSVDPSCADIADKKIEYYSQLFPSKEDIFFYSLSEGKSYKIGGWVDENTTVRARK